MGIKLVGDQILAAFGIAGGRSQIFTLKLPFAVPKGVRTFFRPRPLAVEPTINQRTNSLVIL
jgi:hypothetical protein